MNAVGKVVVLLSVVLMTAVPAMEMPTRAAHSSAPVEYSAIAIQNTPTPTPTPVGGDCQDTTCMRPE